MSRKWPCLVMAGIAVGCTASGVSAVATVVVPTDQPTIQGAVNAAGAGGTVIINSNATFDETVRVTQSLTIHGGVGFRPTIRATSACGTAAPTCALFFEPNSAAAQMLTVTDVSLAPKSGAPAEVVRVLNRGSGEANLILSNFSIQNSESSGFLAFNIRRLSCSSGLNTVSVQSGSINILGSNENFTGRGGFVMSEGGSLFVSDVDLVMTGIAADAFRILSISDCGQIIFGLSDSDITIGSPTTGAVAELGKIIGDVTATLERNRINLTSFGEGSAGGLFMGGGTGQTYSASITLNRNRFFAAGPDRPIAALVLPSANGAVTLNATNNVLHGMHTGFRLGQNLNNPAGSVVATVANNTVDGSLFDAISLHSAAGSTVTVTAKNNLLAHNDGWGISVTSQPGGTLTVTNDYNGFFANAAGNVQAPLSVGPDDVLDDPVYVDRPDEDFRLGSGSAMINAGDNAIVSTATDFLGAMRIQGGTVDIGASEGGFPVSGATNTPSATPTASSTATPTPPRTATHTRTPTATATASPTATHTRTATPTASSTISSTPSGSITPSATATRSGTPTATSPSSTSTPTTLVLSPTPTTTGSPVSTTITTATPTVDARQCIGDCDGSGNVAVNELVLGVNIALAQAVLAACPALDENGSQRVEVHELVTAVNRALRGCDA